jgi:hypothetical protein
VNSRQAGYDDYIHCSLIACRNRNAQLSNGDAKDCRFKAGTIWTNKKPEAFASGLKCQIIRYGSL